MSFRQSCRQLVPCVFLTFLLVQKGKHKNPRCVGLNNLPSGKFILDGRHLTRGVHRLANHAPTNHGCHHHSMAAMAPHSRRNYMQKSARMLRDKTVFLLTAKLLSLFWQKSKTPAQKAFGQQNTQHTNTPTMMTCFPLKWHGFYVRLYPTPGSLCGRVQPRLP